MLEATKPVPVIGQDDRLPELNPRRPAWLVVIDDSLPEVVADCLVIRLTYQAWES
jgi:hypothetical protein